MQLFGSLESLMALLGTSWPLLGPIWSQNGSQNGPKSGQKSLQKLVPKMTPKKVNFEPILGPKMGPKITLNGDQEARANPAGAILEALVSKMAPRWLKMVPSSPR